MTDDGAKALGLRALRAGFRWAPGCMARRQTGPCFGGHRYTDGNIREGRVFLGGWPDFRDPATLGVLLAQVREAWEPHRGSDYIASTMHTGTGWGVRARYGSEGLATIVECTHETEAHALVAALEAGKEE